MTPRMQAALDAANPHGLVRDRRGWLARRADGGYDIQGEHHAPQTVDALVKRDLLFIFGGTIATITRAGKERLRHDF